MQTLQQLCPKCGAQIAVVPGYLTWCERCQWNLELPEPSQAGGIFARPYAALGRRYSRQLYEEMLHRDAGRGELHPPRFTLARLAAYSLAGLVYLLSLAMAGLAVWFVFFAFPTGRYLGLIPGAFFLALAILTLPGPPRAKGFPLPQNRYPALHRLVERVCQALDCPAPADIIYDVQYNAAFGRFGWRQRPTLVLGLPLLASLEGQELVALISHELAHQVSGDPARSIFLRTAMISLNNWYAIIHPRNRWHVRAGPANFILLIFNLACLPVAYLLALTGFALVSLIWYDGQRSEYLADWLAAQVSGAQGMMGLLAKGQLCEAFESHLRFAYIQRKGQGFFASLRTLIACAPPREYERMRRIEALTHTTLDASHPPGEFRREFLMGHYHSAAKISLSYGEMDRIESELQPLLSAAEQQIFALDELSFRELFGVAI